MVQSENANEPYDAFGVFGITVPEKIAGFYFKLPKKWCRYLKTPGRYELLGTTNRLAGNAFKKPTTPRAAPLAPHPPQPPLPPPPPPGAPQPSPQPSPLPSLAGEGTAVHDRHYSIP